MLYRECKVCIKLKKRPSKKSTVVETMDQNQNHGIEQIPADEMAFCYTGINFLLKGLHSLNVIHVTKLIYIVIVV